jgi:uncharacterized Zn finger protein
MTGNDGVTGNGDNGVPGDQDAGEFGRTWWGRAWVDALEQRARLDPNRLPRGRTYARDGAVGELVLAPGEVRAQVQGRKVAPYDVRVRVRPFADDEWNRVLDAVAAQLGRAAALLDGELPPEVADDVAAAGLDLLPGGGEVGPRCTCPDDADPCKHSAAVCYLVADALDADPFVLLLLRGRTQEQVLAGLRSRRRGEDLGRAGGAGAIIAGSPVGETASDRVPDGVRDGGVDARTVLAAAPPSGPIPVPPMPPKQPGHPAALPIDPPAGRGELREDLLALAADAAARAWRLAVGLDTDAGLGLDADADLARRADRTLGTRAFSALAARSGIGGRELARWGLAWRHGGATGLELLRADWDPTDSGTEEAGVTDLLKAARVALREAAGEATTTVTWNRVTAGRLQLRLGRDFLWYPYARSDNDWEPAGPPQPDPVRAVETL